MTDYRNRLLTRIIAPATEPLTLEETKLYLRVTDDAEEVQINDLIVSARMMAEQWTKRALITQSWKIAYDDYLAECTALPMGPVQSVTSVTIVNKDASTQIVSGSLYYLNAAKDAVVFQSDVLGFRVEILYVTGYGDAQAVPRPIKQGMLSHIASMYDYRGEQSDSAIPAQTLALYMPYRGVTL
jgi:uncharacterized phiE125 gp8 family phage protein